MDEPGPGAAVGWAEEKRPRGGGREGKGMEGGKNGAGRGTGIGAAAAPCPPSEGPEGVERRHTGLRQGWGCSWGSSGSLL